MKTEYAYTPPDTNLGASTATISYDYTDGTWKDLLTSYNGQAISYDTIGNPEIYRDGMAMTWQNGRQLAGIGKTGLTTSYQYDDSGMRIKKTVNGVVTDYYLNGSSILAEVKGGVQTDYYYDESGNLFGFKKGGAEYYYLRNGQNDIIGILDSSGNQVVSYVYDSWGKLISVTGSMASTIGASNPFRYRGYYYDAETGLYSLHSRYYDPETGRFINTDGEVAGIGQVQGYNLFQYCLNNPVNMDDPTGQWPKWVTGALSIVSGVLQATVGAALIAASPTTGGLSAVVGTFLLVNGAATVSQGIGQVVNSVSGSNVMREDNILKTSVQSIGGAIGGDKGKQTAGAVYDAAVVAAGIYAGGVGVKNALQQAGVIPVKVPIGQVYGNPKDPFFTISPKQGLVAEKIRNILNGSPIDWKELQVFAQPNGYYQLNAGHHLYKALSDFGYDTIKIYLG